MLSVYYSSVSCIITTSTVSPVGSTLSIVLPLQLIMPSIREKMLKTDAKLIKLLETLIV